MANDGTNKVDTGQLVSAANDISNIKKGISTTVESLNAIFRKLQDSWSGDSADDLNAVGKQLQSSSNDIVAMLSRYETTLGELAGIYNDAEKKVGNNAGKLKFGGMK